MQLTRSGGTSSRGRSLSAVRGLCRVQRPWPRPPEGLDRLRREIRRATELAPPARLELDQCHCTFETKLRRVLALTRPTRSSGGASSCSATTTSPRWRSRPSYASSVPPRTVAGLAVVDVDPAVLAFARNELVGAPFPTAFVEHDLRVPLPASLRGAFDTVLTDPPYTLPAARLFLSRAAEALAGPVATSSSASARGGRTRVPAAAGDRGGRLRDPAARPRLQPLRRGGRPRRDEPPLPPDRHEDAQPLVVGPYDGPLYTSEA